MAATLRRKIAARPQPGARPSQLSSRTGEFDAMANATVRAVLDELLGEWEEPAHWGLPLVSFHTGQADFTKLKVGVSAHLFDDFDLQAVPVVVVDGKNQW